MDGIQEEQQTNGEVIPSEENNAADTGKPQLGVKSFVNIFALFAHVWNSLKVGLFSLHIDVRDLWSEWITIEDAFVYVYIGKNKFMLNMSVAMNFSFSIDPSTNH